MIIFEACVGNIEEAIRAEVRGASRIELCHNLNEGGTTPSFGTIKFAKDKINIPCMVIIRPRGGNFVYSNNEFETMKIDIGMCKELGVYGVVLGVLDEFNNINIEETRELVELAKPMKITFHMAFDEVEDKFKAIDELVELGVDRILTKGCKTKAVDGMECLKRLNQYANGRIEILAGGGVTKENYKEFVANTGVKEVHGTKIV